MLQSIRDCIHELPKQTFEEFYQDYVLRMNYRIVDYRVNESSKIFTSIEDISSVIKGINTLTEELKKL